MNEENTNQQIPVETPAPQEMENKPATPKTPEDEKILSAMAYLSLAFILPAILKPKSKSCQFHSKQGLGMFVASIAVMFLLLIIPMIGSMLFLAFFGVSILAMYQAYQGTDWEIPVIYDLTKNIDIVGTLGISQQSAVSKEQETAPAPAEEPTEPATAETPAVETAPVEETPAPEATEAPVTEVPAQTEPVTEPTPEPTPTEPVTEPTPVVSPSEPAVSEEPVAEEVPTEEPTEPVTETPVTEETPAPAMPEAPAEPTTEETPKVEPTQEQPQ